MEENAESMLGVYRVLDLTDERGFLCGRILGDLGADVIKIEPPGGDPARRIGPFYRDKPHPEASLYWASYNCNKRGITLDINSKDGQEIFRRLVDRADFVIESFKPGYLDQLGVGYRQLNGINPQIILTSITPYGQDGPHADMKASDIELWAMGGMMYLCGDPDRPPVRISFPQSCLLAGASAATGSLVALFARQSIGTGQHVDVSIQEAVVLSLMLAPQTWQLGGIIPKRKGPCQRVGSEQADRRINWTCKDGHIAFGIYGGATGARTMRTLVDWMSSEGKATQVLQEMDWDKLIPSFGSVTQEQFDRFELPIQEFFVDHTKSELYQEALKRRFMLCPVSTPKDILDDEQLKQRDMWTKVEHKEWGAELFYPGYFAKPSLTPCRLRRRAPLIGEHNEEIYGEVGFSVEEIITLKKANVI